MPRQTLKQRKDGRYKCVYKGIQFYGGTQSAALAARDAYKRQEAQKKPQDVTVMSYVLRWLPAYKSGVTRRTYNSYAGMLECFSEFVGVETLLRNVTKTDIAEYYNTISDKSSSYIHKAQCLIRALFEDAQDDGIINNNPSRKIKPPKGTSGTHRALEPWERQLVHEMVDHPFGVCAMLMLYGGLRRGEALAFDIDRDVDFDEGVIFVRHAVSYCTSHRGTIKGPKTEAGVRTIPLFNPLRAVLSGRHGLAFQAVNGQNTHSAFYKAWSSYINQMEALLNGCSKRWYGKSKAQQELASTGQLPPWQEITIRTHDFRHSFCTMCRDAYVPAEVLVQWMGHKDDTMIRRIYDHVSDQRRKEAKQNVENEMSRIFGSEVQNEVQIQWKRIKKLT